MLSRIKGAIVALAALGGLALAPQLASAMPMVDTAPAVLAQQGAATALEQVRWCGPYRCWHRRWGYYHRPWGYYHRPWGYYHRPWGYYHRPWGFYHRNWGWHRHWGWHHGWGHRGWGHRGWHHWR